LETIAWSSAAVSMLVVEVVELEEEELSFLHAKIHVIEAAIRVIRIKLLVFMIVGCLIFSKNAFGLKGLMPC